MSIVNRTSAMSKDRFFNRRRKGMDYKAKCLVLQDQDVKVTIFYGHGDELSVFRSHPHLENWPFPNHLLGRPTVNETNMESYGTDPKHMVWMSEWMRREGLEIPWAQSSQPNIPEATGVFEGDTGDEGLVKVKSESFLEHGQAATDYTQGPDISDLQDLIGPEWFTTQNTQSPMGAPPPRREKPNIPLQKSRTDSDDDLTDEDYVNLGSENRNETATPDSHFSPQKRARGNDGDYIRSGGPISANHSRSLPAHMNRRMRQLPVRRVRSSYDIHSQNGGHMQDEHGPTMYRRTANMYGSPPRTRASTARMVER